MFADAGELEGYVSAAEELGLVHAEPVLAEARRSLWMMRHEPGLAYRCGAAAVLSVYNQLLRGDPAVDLSAAEQARASEQGMNARQVGELAAAVGLDLVAVALDDATGALSTPSIVHWKLNHFAAVLAERDGRYLVEDAAFGPEYCVWMDRDTLLRESSGYFLIPREDLQPQWRSLGPQEADGIWGRSTSVSTDGNGSSPLDRKTDGQGGDPPCAGLPACAVHLLVVSLNIVDTPVGYSPPRGLPVRFTVTYNQRDLNQPPPTDVDFAHLGPNWSYSWLSYVDDDGPASSNNVVWIPPGGGAFVFRNDIQNPGVVFESSLLGARLRRVGPGYELDLPTGEVYRFSEVMANLGNRRRILLTEMLDLSRANATRLVYDQLATGARRLTTVVDANGYETTLTYPDPAAPLRIGVVTDPFGRTATLSYDAAGRLAGIVDRIGMSSTFGYRGTSTFIETMTTPYGITAFDFGEEGRTRWLKSTHPNGEAELVEFSETPR